MTTKPTGADFFAREAAKSYDERNKQLAPIADGLHFLIRLILRDHPPRARVLCVGVGTGAEILSLARAFPEWTFVGVDPSPSMIDVCRERLEQAGFMSRCELITGYVQDAPLREPFDIGLTILVGHFVKLEDRLAFYKGVSDRLRPQGVMINAEISFDLNSPEFPSMLKGWEGVQQMMGATSESLARLPELMRTVLTVLSPAKTEELLRQSGIAMPVRFYQAMMICAWYGTKTN
jgi:tRNA (cmo5U34)-methyltransferase